MIIRDVIDGVGSSNELSRLCYEGGRVGIDNDRGEVAEGSQNTQGVR